jgi:hypothetical protein
MEGNMATERTAESGKDPREQLVGNYFHLIQQLRSGVEGSVDRLVEMWHPEGTFEFAGAPPVTGTYMGRNAIHVLYRNRLLANGMRLRIKAGKGGEGRKDAKDRGGRVADTALGVVSTEVQRTRVFPERVVAGWKTSVGTTNRGGFEVSGSHTFVFDGDRIKSLTVTVSPKPEASTTLAVDDLAVEDIGELALSAWMVV